MNIEVAVPSNEPPQVKGDLLEELASEFLHTQNCEVTEKVRVTAAELDLLCKHKVNQRNIYVECKAHREPLSSNVLTNLLGKITFKDYQEGWLISSGPLGKDAKGFQVEWESKPSQESQKLSIYTPDRVIESLINSSVIKPIPVEAASSTLDSEELVGEWTLLVTPYGRYWAVTSLQGGLPYGVIVFSAKSSELITEQSLLSNLSRTDTSLHELNFQYIRDIHEEKLQGQELIETSQVVEVKHGEYWSDYRPARPEDFVGRKETQDLIIKFFESVREKSTNTRVFAIKGDSGLGKSSLVAKLRDRFRNQKYRNKYFIYAVDVRAASDTNYILLSLLTCLKASSNAGFGSKENIEMRITNTAHPLESDSIQQYLKSLESKDQVVCLVLDQFEELYAKSDLFPIFEAAENLMISTSSSQSNFALGFAWRTDTSVQQDHPAYYLWHRLADHRVELSLSRFNHAEASRAITIFENELGEKLRPDLRKHILESSQGYPWLLKKLCIHLYDQVTSGISQAELLDKALDVKTLFDRDLQVLTHAERSCLNMIAENAPIDWYEILENFGQEVLHGLQDKRLIIRSGDKLNLYWDIFREYVLSGAIPSIPLSYLPTSPSINSMLRVASYLDKAESKSPSQLAHLTGLSEKTVANVVRDLIMFGAATGARSSVLLAPSVESSNPVDVLSRLRNVLQRHAFTTRIMDFENGSELSVSDMALILKFINPAAQSRERTWRTYAQRMGDWLSATGYIVPSEANWIVQDQGIVNPKFSKPVRRQYVFIGDTSPEKTIQVLDWLKANEPQSAKELKRMGLRNATTVLRRLGLIESIRREYHITQSAREVTSERAVFNSAKELPVIKKVIDYIKQNPNVTGTEIGSYINKEFDRTWTHSSEIRIGNSLRRWGYWIMSHL